MKKDEKRRKVVKKEDKGVEKGKKKGGTKGREGQRGGREKGVGWKKKGVGGKKRRRREKGRKEGKREEGGKKGEAAGVSHDSPRAQTRTFEGPGLQRHQNSTRRPPREGRKKEKSGGRGKKKSAKFWAPTVRGPTFYHLRGPNFLGSGPPFPLK